MESHHHPISLKGREDRIIDYANRWKPGDPTPYPHFIQDLREVLDSRALIKRTCEEQYEVLRKHGLTHMT